jgi:signal transduction histidine kinase
VLRFVVGEGSHGLLLLWSDEPGFFNEPEVVFYENVAQTIGMALADRRAQAALRERVKELTCLYSLHRLTDDRSADLHTTMAAAVRLLPPAWLYVDAAAACIRLDDCSYATPGYDRAVQRLESRITVRGESRGLVEVVYLEARPELDEGPFLREERSLIDSVARHIGQYLEQRLADSERIELEAQLRHADRLATIGQLAAGVAHELNEPVANVLGFAQLAAKAEGLPAAVSRDIGQIVTAALHAREVVSKLMLFARQKLPTRKSVDLNRLVEDGLYFLSARCAKSGIDLERRLEPGLPELAADPGQLQQVLVNLVVNAIQAMPGGGRLTITTGKSGDEVVLDVADTGTGMTEDVVQRIFVPFFTTKGVGEGTGLGLPVVHGIVTGHGGRIEVKSAPGQGTRVRVYLPLGGADRGGDDDENS